MFLFFLVLSLFTPVAAQEPAFNAVPQQRAVLPGDIDALSVMDGVLYCHASGVLLRCERKGNTVMAMLPDTTLAAMAPEATYVVRHPSGELYVTVPDRKGRMTLMRMRERDGRKPKTSHVKMEGMAVEHPTFTEDGRIMVFASRDGRTVGGSDLWYSLYDGQSWGAPVNMGSRINTKGEDYAPTIYNGWLLFTSTGRDGGTSLYATRLISDRVTGDTIGMLQIGRSPVQRMPEPITHAKSKDYEIAVDNAAACCYWVSTRTGKPQLHSFAGRPEGVMLWGYVKDKLGNRLPHVLVSVTDGSAAETISTVTDSNGFYRIYLASGHNYTVSYRLDEYFTLEENITTPKGDGNRLVAEVQRETVLDRLPMGQRINYYDIYGPNADIELSERGKQQLQQLVRYLCDNPQTSVTLSLSCNLIDDESFNRLLTQQRLQSLQNHLFALVPSSVRMRFVVGDANEAGSASGLSHLAVVITKK